jgi:hypothetical protein
MDRNRNWTVILALAAGLLGGVLSRYVTLPSVHAQSQPPNAFEIKSQRFSLVDEQGRVIGTFTGAVTENPGGRILPRVALVDPEGRELWSAGGRGFKYLSENSK